MCLTHDNTTKDYDNLSHCFNKRFGAINDFNKHFLALVASAGHLNKLHLENTMSAITLTRAYEWCANIVADPTKLSTAVSPARISPRS